MSLAEIIPVVESLPRSDKLALRDLLDAQLRHEEIARGSEPEAQLERWFQPGDVYEVCTPEFSFEAVEALRKLVDEHAQKAI